MRLRDATPDDLPAIEAIYNHYVATSTCTFQTEPGTAEERRAWFDKHGPAHPVIVAEGEGAVIGWGSLSAWNARQGYRFTVEDSIYLRADARGRGVGTVLLAELVQRAAAAGYHAIIAGVSADQEASLRLHERAGFERVAFFKEVGWKFGRWIGVVYLEKLI